MPRAKNDLEVMAPTSVTVTIGGQVFEQRPLTLRRTAALINAIAQEVQKAALTPALGGLMEKDLSEMGSAEMLPVLMQVLSAVPDALPRILVIILTGKEDEETVNYIDDNASLVDATRILRTFIEQNQPEELIENFIVLRTMVSEAIASAQAKAKASSA